MSINPNYIYIFIAVLAIIGFAYVVKKKKRKPKVPARKGIIGFKGAFKREVNHLNTYISNHPKYGQIWKDNIKFIEYQETPTEGNKTSLGRAVISQGGIILYKNTYDLPNRERQNITAFIGKVMSHEFSHVYLKSGHTPELYEFARNMQKELGFI